MRYSRNENWLTRCETCAASVNRCAKSAFFFNGYVRKDMLEKSVDMSKEQAYRWGAVPTFREVRDAHTVPPAPMAVERRCTVKRVFTMSRLQFRTFVAGFFISTLLIELTPIGPPALASEIGANDFRISDMGPDGDAN